MPKRIEFIAPVAAVRGNMSGKQKLLYAKNDNPAYDAPVGVTSYARNYRTSYVGAKVSSTGLCYFGTRTKNAVTLTTKQKKAMAIYGGTFALIGSIMALRETNLTLLNSFYTHYGATVRAGLFTGTFRQYLTKVISSAIKNHSVNIRFAGPQLPVVTFENPWESHSWDSEIQPNRETFIKFVGVNSQTGFYFSVDGATAVSDESMSFEDLIPTDWNVLGLTAGTVAEGMGNLMLNGMYVCKANDQGVLVGVSESDDPIEGYNYVLDAAPHPVSA